MSEHLKSKAAGSIPTPTQESETPKPLESYTAEEQEILRFVAEENGKDYAEQHAYLILDQARNHGVL